MAQLLSCYQSDRQTSRNNAHTEDKALDLTYQDTLLKFLALQDFRDQSIIAKKTTEFAKDRYFNISGYNWIFLAYNYLLDDKID